MLEKITILYVEDDKNIASEVEFFLSKKVKNIYTAYNGIEGIELFHKYKPDIIITDIEMPKLNGFEMIETIKKSDKQTPIIVISAFSETNKLIRGIELGVDSYLIKPINLKTLLQKIENLTKSKLLEKKLVEITILQAKEKELKEAQKKLSKMIDEQNVLLSLFNKGESVLFKCKNDEKWSVEYVSQNVEQLFPGYINQKSSKPLSFSSFIHKDDFGYVQEQVQKAIETEKDFFSIDAYRIIDMENKIKWVTGSTVTQKDSQGNIIYFIGSICDITQKKLTEEKIKNYLALINENLIVVSTNLDGYITEVSDAFCELVGYKKEEIIGKKHNIFKDPSVDNDVFKTLWETITKNEIYQGELKNIAKDGSVFWVKVKIIPLFDNQGVKKGYFAVKQNITDKKLIEELSITDELTKLYNRRHFNEYFKQELNRAKRDYNTLAFVMIDIDHFKLYNDTYGHQAGDEVLISVAKVLKQFSSRAGDNAFRIGGEEFGLILIADSSSAINEHLKRLRDAIEALSIEHKKNSVSKYVTASLGYVLIGQDNDLGVEDLYKRADSALYKAKENGRNQVVLHR